MYIPIGSLGLSLFFFFTLTHPFDQGAANSLKSKMYQIGNIYGITAIAVVGGGLFGFDISSISAIIVTDQYVNYFHNPAGLWQGGIGAALVCIVTVERLRSMQDKH